MQLHFLPPGLWANTWIYWEDRTIYIGQAQALPFGILRKYFGYNILLLKLWAKQRYVEIRIRLKKIVSMKIN